MDSSLDPLTQLQRDLLGAFFDLEQRFALTGGAALAGFHLHHRASQDLDLFAREPIDLELAGRTLDAAAGAIGAQVSPQVTYPQFRRSLVRRGTESTLVDLVIDTTKATDGTPENFGRIRVDSVREIAAAKLCAVLGRAELRDLVDLKLLLDSGMQLDRVLEDAQQKDAGVDPATLAWLLGSLRIGADAVVPGPITAEELDRFRGELTEQLRHRAFPGRSDHEPPD